MIEHFHGWQWELQIHAQIPNTHYLRGWETVAQRLNRREIEIGGFLWWTLQSKGFSQDARQVEKISLNSLELVWILLDHVDVLTFEQQIKRYHRDMCLVTFCAEKVSNLITVTFAVSPKDHFLSSRVDCRVDCCVDCGVDCVAKCFKGLIHFGTFSTFFDIVCVCLCPLYLLRCIECESLFQTASSLCVLGVGLHFQFLAHTQLPRPERDTGSIWLATWKCSSYITYIWHSDGTRDKRLVFQERWASKLRTFRQLQVLASNKLEPSTHIATY